MKKFRILVTLYTTSSSMNWLFAASICLFIGRSVGFPKDDRQCGGDFTGSMDGLGPIKSPNYPNRYPEGSDCDWRFRLQDGDKITFDVSNFDVEPSEQLDCAYDFLTFSFCNDTDFCQPINAAKTNYCGTKPFSVAYDIKKGTDDKTPYVKLHFESDDRLQFKGFSINVKTELNDLCEGFCFNGGICSIVNGVAGCDCRTGTLGNRCEVDSCCSNCPSYSTCNHVDCSCVCPANFSGDSCQTYPTCGGTITLDRPGKGGVIKSLLYPNGCAPNESCKYTFDAGIVGYSVQLDFTSSFLQCGSQPSVIVTDGTTKAVYDICGTFTSKNPVVILQWSTGAKFAKNCGFSVEYTKIETNMCYNYECLHGGTCVSSFLKPSCNCLLPYHGDHCKYFKCISYECENGGTCVSQENGYFCRCPDGYEGRDCQNKSHPCKYAQYVCKNGGKCVEDAGGKYHCDCSYTGYTGDICEIFIPGCIGVVCYNGGTCIPEPPKQHAINNILSGEHCLCSPPWRGPLCEDRGPGICGSVQPEMCGHGHCVNDSDTDYHCQCDAGYTGEYCTE